MTRALAVAVVVLGLTLGSSARAQVDFAKIRAGVQGCPQLAADPELGSLAAFFCEPVDRTILDLPISGVSSLIKVRAGSFSLLQRYPLLAVAQGTIPDSQYAALIDQLFAGQVPSIPADGAEPSAVRGGGPGGSRGRRLARGERSAARPRRSSRARSTRAIPDLLLARIDRDRLEDLRAGRSRRSVASTPWRATRPASPGDLELRSALRRRPTHAYVPPELAHQGRLPVLRRSGRTRQHRRRSAVRVEQPRCCGGGIRARHTDPGDRRGPLRPRRGRGRECDPRVLRRPRRSPCRASPIRASTS